MRNRRLLAYMLLLLLSVGGAASSREDRAAAEKAVRMKTTRQLKEILTELEIKFPKDADKEDLKELALKHDAIARWEELHPEKKKMPRGPAGHGGASAISGMADMLFQQMDADGDDRLSKEEWLQGMMGSDEGESSFAQMDADMDGYVSRDEASAFFAMLQERMGAMGGGGMGGGVPPEMDAESTADYDSDVIDDPDDVGEDDDDELPAHDEM